MAIGVVAWDREIERDCGSKIAAWFKEKGCRLYRSAHAASLLAYERPGTKDVGGFFGKKTIITNITVNIIIAQQHHHIMQL